MSVSFNILLQQKDQIRHMLQLQCEPTNNTTNHPWKIIIYDDICKQILAPLFSISELHTYGITLFLSISSTRQSIPNTPAIYFIHPSQTNIDLIINDLSTNLYDTYYLNFSLTLPRHSLEYLATKSLTNCTYHRITKLYDQYLHFISLSNTLFTLGMKNSYQSLNQSQNEHTINSTINKIVQCLFSVLVTLQIIPVIRAQRNSAAEKIAHKLALKLSVHLQSTDNLFIKAGINAYGNRPLLLLMDRSIDFAIALHHSPIYQSLIHDLIGLQSNHITFCDQTMFLDFENDQFWNQNSLQALPTVQENHKLLLQWYSEQQQRMADDDECKDGTLLKDMISDIPEVLRRKGECDKHMIILKYITNLLNERSISEYFLLEESLMLFHRFIDERGKETFGELMSVDAEGSVEDKLRLLLIFYLCFNESEWEVFADGLAEFEDSEMKQYLNMKSECKIASIKYLQEHKSLMKFGQQLISDEFENDKKMNESTNNSSTKGSFAEWFQSGRTHLENLTERIKSMLPTSGKCIVTRITLMMMNIVDMSSIAKSSMNFAQPVLKNIDKKYITFDAIHMSKNRGGMNEYCDMRQIGGKEYNRAIVFLCGGGSFCEYANLMEFAKKKKVDIIYGCTDLLAPNNFLTQLTSLGSNN